MLTRPTVSNGRYHPISGHLHLYVYRQSQRMPRPNLSNHSYVMYPVASRNIVPDTVCSRYHFLPIAFAPDTICLGLRLFPTQFVDDTDCSRNYSICS